jgi:putative ferrous iron transport protein C
MIVTQVRDYLKINGQASLRDMALEFNMDQDALRPIISQWIDKGKVRILPSGSSCQGGCTSCAPDTIEIFEWIN